MAGCDGFGGLFGDTIIFHRNKIISTNFSRKYGPNGDYGSPGIGGLGGFLTQSFEYGSINQSKNDYLKHINEISSEFEYSFFINRTFFKNISN